ncbi:hypothetical protein G6F57_021392 [Rhizopus arrhizus]|nr:hypothetical protein G6F57_021392 [Rhizopus arrhizus]
MKAMSIIGSYVGNLTELQELMELVRAGKVPPMPVHRHALAEADSVLSALRAGKVVGRAVLTSGTPRYGTMALGSSSSADTPEATQLSPTA